MIWLSDRDNALRILADPCDCIRGISDEKEELEELLAACSESLLARKKSILFKWETD